MNRTLNTYFLLGVSCLALAACGTSNAEYSNATDRSAKLNRAMEQAASHAAYSGNSEQALSILESRYKRNSDDPFAAVEYARVLRENEYLNRASIVLGPFARQEDAPLEAKNEFAAIQLALGNFTVAEDLSQQVIKQDDKNYRAFQNLGVALDSQGMNEEAERAYRKGLEHWQGDPTPIMNNLALNLATQGYVDEAVEILQKAKSIAPDRMEVERNLRIVSALQETAHWSQKKDTPDIKVVPKKKPETPAT